MGHLLPHISASSTTNKDLKCRLYGRFAVVQVHFYFHLVKANAVWIGIKFKRIMSHAHQAKSEEKSEKQQRTSFKRSEKILETSKTIFSHVLLTRKVCKWFDKFQLQWRLYLSFRRPSKSVVNAMPQWRRVGIQFTGPSSVYLYLHGLLMFNICHFRSLTMWKSSSWCCNARSCVKWTIFSRLREA